MQDGSRAKIARLLVGAALAAGVAGCQDSGQLASGRSSRPISSEMMALFANKGVDSHSPMLIRTFKKEAEFEVWKMKADGRYVHVKTFPMCRWSGQLGPKVREGDRQVPEGFYTITPGQMNPNSAYYLSFNVGYPNALDRAQGHSGGSIMVHGACSSAGCFSMTDQQIADIYAVARESFGGGQRAIQMQSFPFRMTAENLAKHRLDPNIAFWRNLKEGSDHFEVTKTEPTVGACGRKYVFDATTSQPLDAAAPCPALKEDPAVRSLVAEKQARDNEKIAELVAQGVKPVRVVYADGGQHPDFASRVGDVSRPDALAAGATEIALDEPKGRSPVVKLAAARARAKDEAAKPGQIVAARTDGKGEVHKTDPTPTATAFAPPPPADRSAMAAATAGISSWMGFRKDEPKPAAPELKPVALEPVTPAEPAAVPLPPARAAAKPPRRDPHDRSAALRDPRAGEFVALEPARAK